MVGLLLIWELLTRLGYLPPSSIPAASETLVELALQTVQTSYWQLIWDTLFIAIAGLVVAAVIALPLALLIGLNKSAHESTLFVIEFLKPIPPIALIPLVLLLWGPTPEMKLFLVVLGALWPLLTQLVYGVKEISGAGTDMARSYKLGPWLTFRYLIIPSLLPFALTGTRVAAAIAVIIAIVAEMVGGVAGLGQGIVMAQTASALPQMYALIITAGLLGLAINAFFRVLERPLLFWHPSQRNEGGR